MQETSKRLDQPIVFENRVGAGGRMGLDTVMRAAPDGYILGGAPNALIVVQALVEPRLFVEPVKNYSPIIPVLETYLLREAAPMRRFAILLPWSLMQGESRQTERRVIGPGHQQRRTRPENIGWTVKGEATSDFTTTIRSDLETFQPIVRSANITIN